MSSPLEKVNRRITTIQLAAFDIIKRAVIKACANGKWDFESFNVRDNRFTYKSNGMIVHDEIVDTINGYIDTYNIAFGNFPHCSYVLGEFNLFEQIVSIHDLHAFM